jgi:hypothetical protein
MRKGLRVKNKRDVRGLSPVIATVLLIVLVVAIALIVFLWVRGMTQEAITKFGGSGKPENIQLICGQVSFEASYTAGTGLYITNPGSIPIFGIDAKEIGDGSHKTIDLRDNANWPTVGLNQGGVFSDQNFNVSSGVTEMVLIPVLIGESDSGRKTYVCDEAQYGYQIMV